VSTDQTTRALGKDVGLNSWFLQCLGVDSKYRGKGIGRKLVKIGEEKVRIIFVY
jgi:ribosomal protein S18 acetylase RimI-like enzyme